jgi:SP family general alpha glucoside:H+ symporter-like MFS transporter
MISPDAANLGIKAVYVWAGLLVPFTILLWLYYPEVSQRAKSVMHPLTFLKTYGRTYWELDELYERKIPAWKFKDTPTSSDQSGNKNAALMSECAKQEVKVVA